MRFHILKKKKIYFPIFQIRRFGFAEPTSMHGQNQLDLGSDCPLSLLATVYTVKLTFCCLPGTSRLYELVTRS